MCQNDEIGLQELEVLLLCKLHYVVLHSGIILK